MTGPIRVLLLVVLLSVLGTGCGIWADKTMDDRDFEECRVLETALLAKYTFPDSVWGRGKRALYCRVEARGFFGRVYTQVTAYGVIEKERQDEVLATLAERKGRDFKPIIVRFYEKENFEYWESSTGRGGTRNEVLLREVIMK